MKAKKTIKCHFVFGFVERRDVTDRQTENNLINVSYLSQMSTELAADRCEREKKMLAVGKAGTGEASTGKINQMSGESLFVY